MRNQISRLQHERHEESNIYKVLRDAVKEFTGQNYSHHSKRWIILMTNTSGSETSKRVSFQDVKELMKAYDVNLVVLGYDVHDKQTE